jgi:hypothetical protein
MTTPPPSNRATGRPRKRDNERRVQLNLKVPPEVSRDFWGTAAMFGLSGPAFLALCLRVTLTPPSKRQPLPTPTSREVEAT